MIFLFAFIHRAGGVWSEGAIGGLNVWKRIALFMIRWVIFIMREAEGRKYHHHHQRIASGVCAKRISFCVVFACKHGGKVKATGRRRKNNETFYPYVRIVYGSLKLYHNVGRPNKKTFVVSWDIEVSLPNSNNFMAFSFSYESSRVHQEISS